MLFFKIIKIQFRGSGRVGLVNPGIKLQIFQIWLRRLQLLQRQLLLAQLRFRLLSVEFKSNLINFVILWLQRVVGHSNVPSHVGTKEKCLLVYRTIKMAEPWRGVATVNFIVLEKIMLVSMTTRKRQMKNVQIRIGNRVSTAIEAKI